MPRAPHKPMAERQSSNRRAQFGTEHLARFLRQPNTVEALFAALDQFCVATRPRDDQTILTVDRI
ncbi:MAG TPA: hypothetical protein VGL00_01715 [Terracidiphilus sp.]